MIVMLVVYLYKFHLKSKLDKLKENLKRQKLSPMLVSIKS